MDVKDTSIQIMDLLKEIAKDKLIIMVTHNHELAKNYSKGRTFLTVFAGIKPSNMAAKKDPVEDLRAE